MSDEPRSPDDLPTGWTELDLGHLKPSDRPIPFRVFTNRFKSSTPESEDFIHDPLAQMQAAPGDLAGLDVAGFSGADLGLELPELRKRWHLTTYVANHHRGLRRIYHFATLTVGPDGLHLMIYKDFDPTE